MAIPEYVARNFKTLGRAAESGNLGMIECADPATGEIHFLLCAVAPDPSGVPAIVFAELLDRNPFRQFSARRQADPTWRLTALKPEWRGGGIRWTARGFSRAHSSLKSRRF
jgi:hypothetical protein